MTDAEARPTAAELLSSALLPAKLEVEASFLRYRCRVFDVSPPPDLAGPIARLYSQSHISTWIILQACKSEF